MLLGMRGCKEVKSGVWMLRVLLDVVVRQQLGVQGSIIRMIRKATSRRVVDGRETSDAATGELSSLPLSTSSPGVFCHCSAWMRTYWLVLSTI